MLSLMPSMLTTWSRMPLLGTTIPLSIFTDSIGVFEVIIKYSYTLKERLVIEISYVRDGYANEEIFNFENLRTAENLANFFNKLAKCDALNRVLTTSESDPPVHQLIISH